MSVEADDIWNLESYLSKVKFPELQNKGKDYLPYSCIGSTY